MAFDLRGGNALITGAAMGMGRLYALASARAGAANIVLWDIDTAGLATVAAEVQALGSTPHPMQVDLADREAIARAATAVDALALPGGLHLLVNNAGVIRGKPFADHDPVRDIAFTMDINALAPMYVTRAFLPAMRDDARDARRILNVASAAGTLSNPNMSVYAASKWAVIGWSDSVRIEMEQGGHAHLAVTTFCPSYISTGMFAGARGPLLTPILTPEQAVERAWRAMVAGRPLLFTPWSVHLGSALKALLPTRAWDFVGGRLFGIYRSMDRFTGRGDP